VQRQEARDTNNGRKPASGHYSLPGKNRKDYEIVITAHSASLQMRSILSAARVAYWRRLTVKSSSCLMGDSELDASSRHAIAAYYSQRAIV
jgi:hypothetical protein